MERVTTVIVDDELLARRGLKTLVERRPEFDVVALCADGREAVAQIADLRPDLVLLDIQMPEVSGFEVLERLPEGAVPVVVFVTAYDEYAVRAFEARALDYVLKPVSQERLDEALNRALARVRERKLAEYGRTLLDAVTQIQAGRPGKTTVPPGGPAPLQRIMVRVGEAIKFVEVPDIEWIEGADYYVTLHAGGRDYLYRESLKHLEDRLDPAQFMRIHVSAIVNLAKVREIRRGLGGECAVVLDGGRHLPVSRRRRKDLLEMGTARFGLRG